MTRRDLFDAGATRSVRDLVKRPPAVVFEDSSLREATDHMVREGVGRLPVVARDDPGKVVAILTRSDLLAAQARRLDAERRGEPRFRVFARRTIGRDELPDPLRPG